ncbi:MAG TPA: penicillin-binding protein 2 [Bacteroidales bacterium]|nr:penicillin-binding protein 2 [Bacteroidales bacterium]
MQSYIDRKIFIISLIAFIGLVFILRLFYIQVVNTSYRVTAENNSTRYEVVYPGRGLIYDRNGKLMVYNAATYDLLYIPRKTKEFDTVLFASYLNIELTALKKLMQSIESNKYNRYKPNILISGISTETYALLQDRLYKFKGFYTQLRTQRMYSQRMGSHIFGYVGEVDSSDIKTDSYYNQGDFLGKSGVEKSYEPILRGRKGVTIYMVDVLGNVKGRYKSGAVDIDAASGTDITLSIDLELQQYAELLFRNKIGSVVAIEPATGEILALVSSPGYDPNLLVGRERAKNYNKLLLNDSIRPLFNRAVMAQYPPGSTFKVINALIGLQENVITTSTSFVCNHGYSAGSFRMGCHHTGTINFMYSIAGSCNAYYANVFRRILDKPGQKSIYPNYNTWYKHVTSFGLGKRLNSDVPGELRGLVPDSSYFDKKYGGRNRWKSLFVVSMAIGQGELGTTPLQMANMTATIANRGYYYTPHLLKSIEGTDTIPSNFKVKHTTNIERQYFDVVVDGMEQVVLSGTAVMAQVPGIAVCGKTGTAQNPHGDDHSIFVAFAPKDNPKIVIAVYVENAGFGSTWASPIASLMMEKYLTDTITRPLLEQRIVEGNLIDKIFNKKAQGGKAN